MIKIGVAAAFTYPDNNRAVFSKKTLCYIEKDMAAYLSQFNAMPILIPDLNDKALFPFLEKMDGFVFQGGADFAPITYGEKPIGKWQGDQKRDDFELQAMDWAMSNKKPILGICRGMQLLNVYLGGTLYQDIPSQTTNATKHHDVSVYDQLNHDIIIKESSVLGSIYSTKEKVNSIHHQAIKDLGKGLEIVATSSTDNIIEAVEWTEAEKGKVMGVQWHPEFMYNSNVKLMDPIPLYQQFISHCI